MPGTSGSHALATMTSVDTLQRFGLKLFLEPDAAVNVSTFIPVFHRWIQTHAVDGLLIDVADYTHLSDGPSVLLAGYEGNYAIDRSEGRIGLYYYRKQVAMGSLVERFVAAGRTLLKAGILLEADEAVGPVCRFRGDEIQFVANDRLLAPATPETTAALKPALDAFSATLFNEKAHGELEPSKRQDRLRVGLRATRSRPLQDLLTNLSKT